MSALGLQLLTVLSDGDLVKLSSLGLVGVGKVAKRVDGMADGPVLVAVGLHHKHVIATKRACIKM